MKKALALAAVSTVALVGAAEARDQISVAGSSTVLPFASTVAEEFGATFAQFPTPVVESGGSSGGLRQFCEGVGENTIDIANASRAIRDREVTACAEAGVTDIHEVRIGYDGIVFATVVEGPDFELTTGQIYLGLGAMVPVDGEMVDNPYTNWSEVDPSLPDQEILAFIPGENHGTREVFEDNVIEAGCEVVVESLGIEVECSTDVRSDGVAVDIAGDYTETVARVQTNPEGVGVFGLSFYEENRDIIKVASVNGIEPSLETIASGEYPVSRPLFFYVKMAHLDVIPGLREYVFFFLSDGIAGPDGILLDQGLIPMPESELTQERADFGAGVLVE